MTRKTENPASVARCLRLVPEFRSDERDSVVETLDKLDRQLTRFPADDVELELSVKDRGKLQQHVTLEAWIAKFGHLAGTSDTPDLQAALMDVRDDLWEQIEKAVERRRPRAS